MGAGKGTAAEYIKGNYSAEQFMYSDILRDILARLHKEPTRKNLQSMGSGLRYCLGDDILVHTMREDLKTSDKPIRLIDGIRYVNEIDMLRSFENSVLLFLDAPQKLRYDRLVKRGREGEDKMSFEQFQKREAAATEADLDRIRDASDFVIDNSGDIPSLYKQIGKILDGQKGLL